MLQFVQIGVQMLDRDSVILPDDRTFQANEQGLLVRPLP